MKYKLKEKTGSRLEPAPDVVPLQPAFKFSHIDYDNADKPDV
tara:strand:+ start:475 stop:600 length:126 start_codon:yes stop_codon:yes gene_type:complete